MNEKTSTQQTNKAQMESVQRMQDYIEEHFAEEITLTTLAEGARFSPLNASDSLLGIEE